ncbi:MAG: inorganic phosphate transporter [Planctomycetota bacterium]|jgi:PiT family inorganic phosphate transporter
MYQLGGSVILGWALGSNDAANIFGTAVASRMVRYHTAVVLAAVFIILGAVLQGWGGIHTISGLTQQTAQSAIIVTLIAGLTVLLMTAMKLPVSSNQAVVGVVIGMGLRVNPDQVQWAALGKVFLCWVGTPIGAAIIAALLYIALGPLFDKAKANLVTRSIIFKSALLISGSYGAYALGANSVGNVTGVFFETELFEGWKNGDIYLAAVGGASIALGVLTFSRNVMFTVGSRLVQLGAFSALVAILAEAITVHIYAFIGVPVSTSQAVVGAVLGIGLVKSVRTINSKILFRIVLGWIATPLIGGIICYVVASVAL